MEKIGGGKRNKIICTIPKFKERKSQKLRGIHWSRNTKRKREKERSYLGSEDGE